MNCITCEIFNKNQEWRRINYVFPLKFSNVPISQFHAKLSNLRMKIKEWYWTVHLHERIRKKGIRIFFSYRLRYITKHHHPYHFLSDWYLLTTTLICHLKKTLHFLDWEYSINIWQIKKRCFSADIQILTIGCFFIHLNTFNLYIYIQ